MSSWPTSSDVARGAFLFLVTRLSVNPSMAGSDPGQSRVAWYSSRGRTRGALCPRPSKEQPGRSASRGHPAQRRRMVECVIRTQAAGRYWRWDGATADRSARSIPDEHGGRGSGYFGPDSGSSGVLYGRCRTAHSPTLTRCAGLRLGLLVDDPSGVSTDGDMAAHAKDRSRSRPNDGKNRVGRGRPKVCVFCARQIMSVDYKRHGSPSALHDRPREDQGSGQHRYLSPTPARRRPCNKDAPGAGDAPVPDSYPGSGQVRQSARARRRPPR